MPDAARLPEAECAGQAVAALRRGDTAGARAGVETLISAHANSARAWLTASQIHQALGEFDGMLKASQEAVRLAPNDLSAVLRCVEGWICCGRVDLALALLSVEGDRAGSDPGRLSRLALGYQQCEQHLLAHACHEAAWKARRNDAGLLFNLAASCVSLGELDQAEWLLKRLISLHPEDFGAHHQLAMLRPWRKDEHHIDTLRAHLARLSAHHPGRVPLCYALAKEFEDLGEDGESWAVLAEGAALRRRSLAYRVDDDVAAMNELRAVPRPADASAPPNKAEAVPGGALFVLGLPRSGSTLVDRVLSAHSEVCSLGEINDFAFALMRTLGPVSSKLDAIRRAASLDAAPLGQAYLAATASRAPVKPWALDKLPQNFLYAGLIRRALPMAKLVHVRRDPMDVCYAMFKTLFRMGYPFSYSLTDIGHYYLAYHQLMAHWRSSGVNMIEVDYENLVMDLPGTASSLLAQCGLGWEPACEAFHQNSSPTATASAAQVRRPVYRSSVGRWRAHEKQLAPLADFLSGHGIEC